MSAVPTSLMYADALKPKAPKATLNRVSFQPDSGGTFAPTGQNIIRVPVFSAGQFLDTRRSHMRLNLAFTATTGPSTSVLSTLSSTVSELFRALAPFWRISLDMVKSSIATWIWSSLATNVPLSPIWA